MKQRKHGSGNHGNYGKHCRGEGARSAKLTTKQVLEIRARVAAGEKMNAIKDDYGVSRQTMHHIIHRITWKHI